MAESQRFLRGADLVAEDFTGGAEGGGGAAPGGPNPPRSLLFCSGSRDQVALPRIEREPAVRHLRFFLPAKRERGKKGKKRTRPHTEDGLSPPNPAPSPPPPQPSASSQEYFLVIRAERIVRFLLRARLRRRR